MGEERITEMAQLSDLEYLRLSKGGKFLYKLGRFFTGIPRAVGNVFLKLWELMKKGGVTVTGVNEGIKKIFTVTGMYKILKIK